MWNMLGKQRKRVEEIIGSMSGLSSFFTKLTDIIKNTLSWKDSLLSKAMESIRPIHQPTISPIEHKPPDINEVEIEQREIEKRLKPFNELAERLDLLIDSSVKASAFMIEENKIQTSIAAETKLSVDATTKYSKRNILLSVVVIVVSVLSLILSAYAIISSNSYEEKQQLHLQNNSEAIISKLSTIDQLVNEWRKSIRQKSAYEKLLQQKRSVIVELKNINLEQNKKIKLLKRKVLELKKISRKEAVQ